MATHRVGPGKVKPPLTLLLDASFLIAVIERPTTWREDLLEKIGRFDPVVITPVYDELISLANGTNRTSGPASIARDMVDTGALKLRRGAGGRPADDELISAALEGHAAVATIDGALMKQLKALHIEVVTLSGGRVALR